MKKLLVLALLCVATISAQAQKAVTDDQKAVLKELLAKYDTNHDGKLSKDERAQFTPEDKALWKKTFPKTKKKAADATGTNTVTGATGDAKPAAPATSTNTTTSTDSK